jgi:hypothetical protein
MKPASQAQQTEAMRGNQKWLPRFLVMVKWHMGASKKPEFAQMQGVEKITQRGI